MHWYSHIISVQLAILKLSRVKIHNTHSLKNQHKRNIKTDVAISIITGETTKRQK